MDESVNQTLVNIVTLNELIESARICMFHNNPLHKPYIMGSYPVIINSTKDVVSYLYVGNGSAANVGGYWRFFVLVFDDFHVHIGRRRTQRTSNCGRLCKLYV